MARTKGYEKSKAKAAGMAAATRGRSRQFADKADLLAKLADADADKEIDAGVEEWREGKRGVEDAESAECAGAR